jgi:hypothetical protein
VIRKMRKAAVNRARAPNVVPRAMPIVRRFWKAALKEDADGSVAVAVGGLGAGKVSRVVGT